MARLRRDIAVRELEAPDASFRAALTELQIHARRSGYHGRSGHERRLLALRRAPDRDDGGDAGVAVDHVVDVMLGFAEQEAAHELAFAVAVRGADLGVARELAPRGPELLREETLG